MFSREFIDYINNGREEQNIEYKDSMSWTERITKQKTIKAILALSNSPGLGVIIFGVKEREGRCFPDGMQESHYKSFRHDTISKILRGYSDPCPEIKVYCDEANINGEDRKFVIITVEESKLLPMICLKTEYKNPALHEKIELRKSAVYIRKGVPVESAEISSSYEWRELIDRIAKNYSIDLFRKMPCSKYFKRRVRTKISYKKRFEKDLKKELDENELLKKIKSKGYWRIIIRPIKYKKNLINSTENLKDLIQKNKVAFRGWDYPHIDASGIKKTGPDNVSCVCDWPEGPKFEYWRFYKNGQFVHYFSMREDIKIGSEKIKELQQEYGTETNKFLSVISTLYSVTEIFEFTSKLFFEIGEVDGVDIIIELHDVKNRVLFFWGGTRLLIETYKCEYESEMIKIEKIIQKDELVNKSIELSLDVFVEILEAFGWGSVNKDIFREDQRKFLKGIL